MAWHWRIACGDVCRGQAVICADPFDYIDASIAVIKAETVWASRAKGLLMSLIYIATATTSICLGEAGLKNPDRLIIAANGLVANTLQADRRRMTDGKVLAAG